MGEADGDAGAAVEGVHGIHKRPGQFIGLGDGDGEQFTVAAGLQGVQDREREHVVHVVTYVGVEDELNRSGLGGGAAKARVARQQARSDR